MKCFASTFVFFLLTNLVVLRASPDAYTTNFLECLVQFSNSSSILDHIYLPNNASYDSVYENFGHLPRRASSSRVLRPLLILIPHDECEIQMAVRCSSKLGVQIRVRSGGHDYEGLSYTSELGPFAMIDMRNLRSISVDTQENTAWVQTGATIGELYYTVAQISNTLAYTAGTCPTVGVGEHFSGGGYGMMSRKHGLSIDHITDAKVIDANGRILDRRSMGEDLFWAIRGGGGTSFAIILAFKVNLVVVPKTVTIFSLTRSSEKNATQLVHKWQYVSDKFEDNLMVKISITSTASPTNGKRIILASFISLYLGRATDLLSLMQVKFPELGLVEGDCTEMSWIESAVIFSDHSDDNSPLEFLLNRNHTFEGYAKGKSDFVTTPISEQGLEGIWEFLHQEAESTASLQFCPYGGIMNTISESATPFPHRAGNIYMIHYIVGWMGNASSEAETHINWIRRLYSYMEPYVSKSPRRAYFNYRDLDIGGNDKGDTSYAQSSVWGFKYFKNNFDRLVRVKTSVDPSNLFRNEQSIPSMMFVSI